MIDIISITTHQKDQTLLMIIAVNVWPKVSLLKMPPTKLEEKDYLRYIEKVKTNPIAKKKRKLKP